MSKTPGITKAVRLHCLGCCRGSFKAVKFCTCDGVLSFACDLWPHRFGMRPTTAARKFGKEFITPGALPEATVALEDCNDSELQGKLPLGNVSTKSGG